MAEKTVLDFIQQMKEVGKKTPLMSMQPPSEEALMTPMSPQQMEEIRKMPDVVKEKVKEKVTKSLKEAPSKELLSSDGKIAAQLGMQSLGVSQDTALGAGLSTALMTSNPYLIAGSAILGGLAGRAKRKRERAQMRAQAEQSKEMAKQAATQRMATGISQALARSGRRIKL